MQEYDPRQRALEVAGLTGKKLIGDVIEVGVSAARGLQNTLYPDEFEYYALTIELVDSKGRTADFLTFPVMPESIQYDDMKVANIQKTLGGITSIDNDSFTPKTINIAGTFGKRFKLLLRPDEKDVMISVPKIDGGPGIIKKPTFDPKIKSGYATTKILERITTLSSKVDDYGQPFRLYLYNPTLGHNWLVKTTQFQLVQDKSTNGYWRYNCQFTVIAPLEAIVSDDVLNKSLERNLKIDVLQKGATELGNTLVSSIRSYLLTKPGNQ